MSSKNKFLLIWAILFLSLSVHAQEIVFSPDVLPTESVFPDLDSQDMVKNRRLTHAKRFEVKTDLMWVLDELFQNGQLLGINIFYHANNDLGYGIKYYSFNGQLNDYGDTFQSRGADLENAPMAKSIAAFSIINRILYGKLSVSQSTVIPLTFDIQYDLGMNQYGKSSLPYAAIGGSHKLYFDKQWVLDFGYFLQVHQVINPVSEDIRNPPMPDESAFEKKVQISQSLVLGFGYLF